MTSAQTLLAAQPECWWGPCKVHPINEADLDAALLEATRDAWRAAAKEARRYSSLCPDYVERQILEAMP
jgi:hypothetical protein